MSDLLVKLYELPALAPQLARMQEQRVNVRTVMPYEKPRLSAWVSERFGASWAAECEMAFSHRPISCLIATRDGGILGFACYDCTCRDYFGPVGVDAAVRGAGIGSALIVSCLHAMAAAGYAYAIVGAAHDAAFYRKAVGAIEIEGSSPGIYRDRLK